MSKTQYFVADVAYKQCSLKCTGVWDLYMTHVSSVKKPLSMQGGKIDDITVIVAYVSSDGS